MYKLLKLLILQINIHKVVYPKACWKDHLQNSKELSTMLLLTAQIQHLLCSQKGKVSNSSNLLSVLLSPLMFSSIMMLDIHCLYHATTLIWHLPLKYWNSGTLRLLQGELDTTSVVQDKIPHKKGGLKSSWVLLFKVGRGQWWNRCGGGEISVASCCKVSCIDICKSLPHGKLWASPESTSCHLEKRHHFQMCYNTLGTLGLNCLQKNPKPQQPCSAIQMFSLLNHFKYSATLSLYISFMPPHWRKNCGLLTAYWSSLSVA